MQLGRPPARMGEAQQPPCFFFFFEPFPCYFASSSHPLTSIPFITFFFFLLPCMYASSKSKNIDLNRLLAF
ncbi:membrane-associated protein, putative [Bodo saltans]|uniref:Membrane-associated protein, putative n=1 Tax=Bodo saltans TaxID=75058 RepID=A0A0S4JM10_BODSA|nr:membrane-associated protein, putative [Bodo saltans]|eukprot:CUG90947.1 membrane-associated protein, putative [Bodo saltans]